jgi:hypothetical protein
VCLQPIAAEGAMLAELNDPRIRGGGMRRNAINSLSSSPCNGTPGIITSDIIATMLRCAVAKSILADILQVHAKANGQ